MIKLINMWMLPTEKISVNPDNHDEEDSVHTEAPVVVAKYYKGIHRTPDNPRTMEIYM